MAVKAKTSKKSTEKTSLAESRSNNTSTSIDRVKNNKAIIIITLIIVLVFVLAYLSKGLFIAATVNGEPISRLAVIKVLEKQSGNMVLENMITKTLILQEAEKRNINITDADLENEIKTISESLKAQGMTLEQAMEAQGMAREELNDELRVQLALRRMTESETRVTDEEIEAFLTENAAQFTEEMTDAQKRELAIAQLEQQKSSEKTQALIEDLRKNAKIMQFAGY